MATCLSPTCISMPSALLESTPWPLMPPLHLQVNPADPNTLPVVTSVLQEVGSLFPDVSLHLGFDEINQACWYDNNLGAGFQYTGRREQYYSSKTCHA